ncbi:MAG: hypothetical protein QOE29_193, partial [Gaiellaceae bacterium]|nr:hypothetical protein [Gaiellaceae bacterium]
VRSWKQENEENGLELYADWSTPTMLQTLTQDLQKLLGGQKSPADVAKSAQSNWTAYDKSLH